jgi:ATP-binding cassette, subfamily C, bacterial CydCD
MKLSPRLLQEARQSKAALLLAIFLSLIAGVLSIFQARQISTLVNKVFLQAQGLQSVSGILLIVLVIILVRAAFVWGGEAFASAAARRIKHNLRQHLYTHILNLGPAYLRGEAGEAEVRTGELVNVTTEGVEALEAYFSQYLPQVALAVLVPVVILVFVFQADVPSGLVMLVTAPLLPLFMYLIGSGAEVLTRRQWQGLSRMSAYFLDVLQGLTTLKSLGRSRDQVAVIRKVSEQYRQSTLSVLRVTFLSAMVLEMVATLSTAVVAVEIGIRLLYGRMAFEQAFFVLLLAPEFYQPLRLLGTRFHAGMAGVEAGKRIFALLDLPASQTYIGHLSPSSPENGEVPAIKLKDISFTYSNNNPALRGVSIRIPPRKTTALVGESGAGKTTLTWLILRFLQPQKGEIWLGGKRLDEIPMVDWLSQLAWVPQNPYLFKDTVSANIKLSRPEATEVEILQAAQMAHADGFIARLPQGYETLIGEGGLGLSAGQVQRIALARAFLKDAPFLILDEPTSHLDPETDSLLQESLRRLRHNRTVLMIAHHRSSLARADQVIRLSQGQVVQVEQVKPSISANPMGADNLKRDDVQTESGVPALESRNKPGEGNAPQKPATLSRLLGLLAPFTGQIALSMLLGFATIASSVGLMATAAYIISAAALHPSIADLSVAIVGVRFFGISRGIFRYLERLVSHDVTLRLLARWRVWFYQALEPLAPARLMHYHSGDLLSRVISDIGSLESFYVRTVAPPLVALLVGIVVSVWLGTFSLSLTWVFVGFLLLAGVGLPFLVFIMAHQLGPQLIQARAGLYTVLVDGIQGLADLLTNGRAEDHHTKVEQAGDSLLHLQGRMANISAMQAAMSGLLANLCLLMVLALAIPMILQGQLAGVFLGTLALGALMSFEAVQPLPMVAQNLEANREAARRLYTLADASPAVSDTANPVALPEDHRLEVRELSFQYPDWSGDEPAMDIARFRLSDITFCLPDGKHIAILGASGAGKTTLVNLLLRFWDYQHGSVSWGGNDLRFYKQDDVRQHIGIIAQNTYLFSATIGDNLRIARPDATDKEILQALEAAHFLQFVQSSPESLDTWVGEHGLRLSAGERQRLSIARALLKNAPLLILDEPTVNLDPVTESEVLGSIEQLVKSRSTISITQRMVGLEKMDEILVLENGRIIERGTHAALLSLGGIYKRMWELYNQVI